MKLNKLPQLLILCLTFFNANYLVASQHSHNTLNFNLENKTEVSPDLANIALTIDENFNHTNISENKQNLVAVISKYPQIKVKKSINSYPIYAKDNSISKYQKFINYNLTLNKIDLLNEILEQVANYSTIINVNYDLSSQKKDKVVEKLTAGAIAKFKQQSNFLVEQFGATKYQINNINLNEQINHLSQAGYTMYRSKQSSFKQSDYAQNEPMKIDLSVEISVHLNASIKLNFKK